MSNIKRQIYNESSDGWKITYETAEKKQKYFNLLQEVYKDGDVESFEREKLKQLQFHLGLSDSEVKVIESKFKEKTKERRKKQEEPTPKKKRSSFCRECCYERSR